MGIKTQTGRELAKRAFEKWTTASSRAGSSEQTVPVRNYALPVPTSHRHPKTYSRRWPEDGVDVKLRAAGKD